MLAIYNLIGEYNLYNCILACRGELNPNKKSNKKSFQEYKHLVCILETNIENKLVVLYEVKKLLELKKLAIAEKKDFKGLLLKNPSYYSSYKEFVNVTLEEGDDIMEKYDLNTVVLNHIKKNIQRLEQIWSKL